MSTRFSVGLLICTVAFAAAPAVARADDAAVRKAVISQEKKVAPDNKAFSKALDAVNTKSDVPKAQKATDKLITDVAAYRSAVSAAKGTTADVKKGRTKLLAALSVQRSGLRSLKSALTKYAGGESEASVKKSLKAATAKLTAGQKSAAAAVKLIGGITN